MTLVLALDEPLPGEPKPLPSKAPHLTDHFFMTNKGEIIRTTIDAALQERASEIFNSSSERSYRKLYISIQPVLLWKLKQEMFWLMLATALSKMPELMEEMLI